MSTSEPGRGKRPRSQRGAVEDRWRKRGKDEPGRIVHVEILPGTVAEYFEAVARGAVIPA